MSHAKDCPNRPVRRGDGIRGFYCDSREDPTSGIVSTTNTMYEYEKVGSGIKVTGIRHSGAVVSQMFGSDGFSQIVLVNTTVSLIDEVSSPGGIAGSGSLIDSLTYEFSDWHQWDHDRNLKAIEPITSSGMYQAKPLSRTKGELLTG